MAKVFLVQDRASALRRDAVARLADALRQAGHEAECSWRVVGHGRVAALERALDGATFVLLVDPGRWWAGDPSADPWLQALHDHLRFDSEAGRHRFAIIVSAAGGPRDPVGARDRDGLDRLRAAMGLEGVPGLTLPQQWTELLALLQGPRPELAALPADDGPELPAELVEIDGWLDALDAAVAAARECGGGLVWIRGAAGAGKTVTLAAWLARRARAGLATPRHLVRPGIAATRDAGAVIAKLAGVEAQAPGVVALDGLGWLDDLTQIRALWEQGGVLVATSRPLAPGSIEAAPTLDLDDAETAEMREGIVAGRLERASLGPWRDVFARVAAANPGVAVALIDEHRRGSAGDLSAGDQSAGDPVEDFEPEVPRAILDAHERSFARMLARAGARRRDLLAGLALIHAAAEPLPRPLYEAASSAPEREAVEELASEWLRAGPEHLAFVHDHVARYLDAELDDEDPSPHTRLSGGLGCLRRGGELDPRTQAYAEAHERRHRLRMFGLDPSETWTRDIEHLSLLAEAGELEGRLAVAVAEASAGELARLTKLQTIVRRHRAWLAADPGSFAARLWTDLVAQGEASALLREQFDWGEAPPPLRLRDALRYFDRSARVLLGSGAKARGCAIDDHAKRAITVDADGELRLWSVASGELLGQTKLDLWADACAITPEGELAVVGARTRVSVWKLDGLEQIEHHTDHGEDVEAVAVSVDGRYVLSGDEDGVVIAWDRERGKRTRLGSHRDRVTCCALSSDGRLGVTGSVDQHVMVWDLEGGVRLHDLDAHSYRVSAVALTKDGARAVSVGIGEAHVWDTRSGEAIAVYDDLGMSCAGVVIVDENRQLLMAEADERVFRASLATGEILGRHIAHGHAMTCMAASGDGRTYITVASDGLARLWRAEAVEAVDDDRYVLPINALTPGADGRSFWIGGPGVGLRKLALTDGRELVQLSPSGTPQAICDLGDRVVSVGSDKRVEVHAIESGESLESWEPTNDWLRTVAASPDRARLAYAGDQNVVFLSDLEGGKLRKLRGHGDWVHALDWTEDGRIVSVDNDGELRVWDAESGRCLLERASDPARALYALALDRGGGRAFVGGLDTHIEVLALDDGHRSRRFEGHRASITGLALARDDRALVSCSEDGSLRLWEVDTGRELARVELTYGLTRVIVVGDRVVATDRVGNHLIFDLDWAELGLGARSGPRAVAKTAVAKTALAPSVSSATIGA